VIEAAVHEVAAEDESSEREQCGVDMRLGDLDDRALETGM
jgi:hypothetical protein